jgi:hypothetical protein
MEWTIQDLGAVGEFISSLVVLITLIYLVIQIRQNTQSIESSARQSVQDMILNTDQNERYINYLMKAERQEELTREECVHMVERFNTIMRGLERIWYEFKLGGLPAEQFTQHLDLLRWAMSPPEARRMWAHLAQTFDSGFQKVVVSEVLSDEAPVSSLLKALAALEADQPVTSHATPDPAT